MTVRRRTLFSGAAASLAAPALAAPALAQAPGARVLKMVPQANLTSIDPIWTTANITRNHGFLVYDTLFGLDAEFRVQPQMAEGAATEADGRLVKVTLRDGLRFHDGEAVRASDCVASIARWMKRNPTGQKLEPLLDELVADGDRRIVFRLKRPFPALLRGLGSPTNPVCFIMPERMARTDPFTQIRDATGSGPFRYKADEFNSGSLVVYERNAGYAPSPVGRASLTAGPKVAHFDRVEWRIITDAATSAAALQAGEIDWFEQPPPEIQQQLTRRARGVVVEAIDPLPLTGILRFNHLHPPFDRAEVRRAILPAIDASDYMAAIVGPDPALYRTDVGFFTPGTPMASDAGLAPLTGPRSIDRAKALLREAGYANEPIRVIGPTDILAPTALTQVGGDMFRRLGVNLDLALSDWGTVVQRRISREPVERGGWSVLYTAFSSFEFLDPAAHTPLRGNGLAGWPGWPTSPQLEALRDAWFEADGVPAQAAICRTMQEAAMVELPYVPVGAYTSNTALKRELRDRVSGFAIFWGIRRG